VRSDQSVTATHPREFFIGARLDGIDGRSDRARRSANIIASSARIRR